MGVIIRAQRRENSTWTETVAELFEELAGNRGHEARWDEHRNDRQNDRDDCKADLVGRLETITRARRA